MWWLVPILVLPFFELWSLLELGALVGVWATLAWCAAMVALGLVVVRAGRARLAASLRAATDAAGSPWAVMRPGAESRSVLQEGLVVIAGGLIAFPGIGSDVLGLLLLLPFLRRFVVERARRLGASRRTFGAGASGPAGRAARSPDTPVARDVEVYPPGSLRMPNRRRPVVIDVD